VEEELPTSADGTDRPISAGQIPELPSEISAKEEELRRLVEAGAASPEELRALAAKLEEKRTYEASLWQREVRPALLQSKKRRLSLLDLRRDGERPRREGSSSLLLAALLLAGVLLLLVIATQTSFLWLLVAVVGVLVYAWVQGRRHGIGNDAPPAAPPPDAAD
jgi:hypothetical protein